jgi:hypothetical protein
MRRLLALGLGQHMRRVSIEHAKPQPRATVTAHRRDRCQHGWSLMPCRSERTWEALRADADHAARR